MKINFNENIKTGYDLLDEYCKRLLHPITQMFIIVLLLFVPLKLLGADTMIDFLFIHFKMALFAWVGFSLPSSLAYVFLLRFNWFVKLIKDSPSFGVLISGLILMAIFFPISIIGFQFNIPLLVFPMGVLAYSLYLLVCYFPFVLMTRFMGLKVEQLIGFIFKKVKR